jgi:ribonucleoside-diphosphate reductase alpha chain
MKDEKAWKWLNENELSYKIWNNKYRNDNESFDDWLDRVSNGNMHIRRLILEKKFLFGGRTLANRGTNKGSLNNCYSAGYVPDSLDGIMQTARDIAMTFKAQGGQGISLSKIRPKGALIKNTFESDGIVPFMEIFNTVTASVSQGGHRRGALMMSLDINHPEAETFMTIKSDHGKITNANLSMEIDDEFMTKVISSDEEANRKFDLLCMQACKHAEPGVLFTNRLRNYNLMEYIDSYQIETTNPCGEQPLPKHGACGLCSINLSEYVLHPFTKIAHFDYDTFAKDAFYIVEAMDDIIQENLPNHALDEQRDVATRFRNLGIGVMGVQDMLIKLGHTYGSALSIKCLDMLMADIATDILLASAKLAEIRGTFPEYSEKIFESTFFKNLNLNDENLAFVKKVGLRNSTLLSVAPTGSIGTMLNISSGVEPWFAIHYTRNTKSLEGKEMSHEVWAPIAEEAKKRNWHPETLVTSNDISWKEHIDIQAVIQKYVDTAVSKTINMPKGTTPQEVREAYVYAWKKGLKGLTVYVDGSRDPILTTDNSKSSTSIELDYITPVSRDTFGEVLIGHTFKKKTACGTLYITINKDEQGNIVEIFTNSSKNGTCKANLNGETRMASLALRAGVKVDEVVEQLKGIHCQSCAFARAKGNQVDGTSCPDIMAKCIKEACSKHKHIEDTSEKCPECGKPVRHEGGCVVCDCGFSKCG